MKEDGWKIEFGLPLGNQLGDADILCISPHNQAFVIDVKSHKGEVLLKGDQLVRKLGTKIYPFEKDFLSQAMNQAFQVKQQKSLDFVTLVIAFSNASVSIPHPKIRGVFVVQKNQLIHRLRSLA